jgi:PAS domain S-box-containing protein
MGSFLGVPIIRGGKVLGNLYMADKLGAEEFSEDDEDILSLFAIHAAIGIENARLYTETDTRLREKVTELARSSKREGFLSDLGALLLRLPPGQGLPLEKIAEQAVEALADAVAIVLVDPSNPGVRVAQTVFHQIPGRQQAAVEVLDRSWGRLLDQVIVGLNRALAPAPEAPGEAVFAPDVLEEARFSAAFAVPIATRQTSYGLLACLATRPQLLTHEDLHFGVLIADRLGSALDSMTLYQQQQEARAKVQELAELAQQRANELEATLDTMSEAVYVVDTSGRLLRVNQSFARLVGLEGRGHAGESFRQLMDRLQPQNETEGLAAQDLPMPRALRGETFTDHVIRITPVGTQTDRFLSVSGAPILDGAGKVAAAVNVARDVTELKELDRLKDEFISVASHEMRTPLTVIKGYSQVLERRLQASGPEAAGALSMARQVLGQTERLATLTDRLLDVSRVQFGRLNLQKERTDLSSLVVEAVERIRVSADGHAISVSAGGPLLLEGDAGRLDQVIVNLISNAVKYSPEGTSIEVRLERRDGSAVLSVRDHGFGIPKERQGQIFQRFYRATTDERTTGLGLGLYVSKGIVEAHGGEIWFESEEGKGTIFHVRLPVE